MHLQGAVQNLKQAIHTRFLFLKGFHRFPLFFFRTIWKLDVPTSVTKCAPSSCSVYVIAKGKISSFRPATYADDNSKGDFKSNLPVKQLAGVKCVSVTPLFLGLYNTNLG